MGPRVGGWVSQNPGKANLTPPPPKYHYTPATTTVQATVYKYSNSIGVGSVKFRTVDFGGAFFDWPYCVLCVLSDTFVLRCMMSIFCVKLIWA